MHAYDMFSLAGKCENGSQDAYLLQYPCRAGELPQADEPGQQEIEKEGKLNKNYGNNLRDDKQSGVWQQ
jgi:hypothetical protein